MRYAWLFFCLVAVAAAGCGGAPPAAKPAGTVEPAEPARAEVDAGPLSAADNAVLQRAIALMDAGQLDESIGMLDELLAAHPGHPLVTYEKAFAVYKRGDYTGSRALVEPMLEGPHAMALMYVLVANAYDDEGNAEQAVKVYGAGIERFPRSGLLFTNLGIAQLRGRQFQPALDSWIAGVEREPAFGSNYYWLARVLADTNARVWSLIYGELFVNLEPTGPRKAEISKIIYALYRDAITTKIEGGKESVWIELDSSAKTPEQAANVCFTIAYEAHLMMSLVADSALTAAWVKRPLAISTIHALRKAAHLSWRDKWAATCPNLAIARYAAADAANVGEAYDYWLFKEAVPAEAAAWSSANPDKVRAFEAWLAANPLVPTAADRFGVDHY